MIQIIPPWLWNFHAWRKFALSGQIITCRNPKIPKGSNPFECGEDSHYEARDIAYFYYTTITPDHKAWETYIEHARSAHTERMAYANKLIP